MFWNKRPQQPGRVDFQDAALVTTSIAGIYAELNDQEQEIKSRSSLPCPWYVAREFFFIAYEGEYPGLSKEVRQSYHHVYRELAFFVDDDLYKEFNQCLDIAVTCRIQEERKLGMSGNERLCKRSISTLGRIMPDKKEIWTSLEAIETCPRPHLLLLLETLTYCNQQYRVMWDEWAAFANLVAFRNK